MSATNRGVKRREADFYATPIETVRTFLNAYGGIKESDVILEPSAGNGNIVRALRECGYKNRIDAIEVRSEEYAGLVEICDNVRICDYLQTPLRETYDVIIGNPPYSLAMEFIDKGISMLKPGGRLIYLLRTNFLESAKRAAWWQDKLPTGLYVCAKRPSFTGRGTDATSYAWFVWENANEIKQTIRVI